MNSANYNFHDNSKKYLAEFLHTVKQLKNEDQSEIDASNWKLVFKKSPHIDNNLEKQELHSGIIDLTIDDDSNPAAEIYGSQLTGIPSTQQGDTLLELANTIVGERGDIQGDFLVILERNCNIDIEELFAHLLNINANVVLMNFGHSLLRNNCSNKLGKSFIKFILIPLAIAQLTDDIKNMFAQFVAKISGVSAILLDFLKSNASIIIELMSILGTPCKLKLFDDCVSNTVSLDIGHIILLDNLLLKEASRDSFQKLIALLTFATDKYVNDKVYGKYLLKIIETLGPDVKHFQGELGVLVRSHKSIWKNKAEKILASNLESDPINVTQSFLV